MYLQCIALHIAQQKDVTVLHFHFSFPRHLLGKNVSEAFSKSILILEMMTQNHSDGNY